MSFNISDEMVEAVGRTLKPWLYDDPHCADGEWGAAERAKLGREVAAGLAEVAPLIAAQALRSAAEDTAGQCSHPDGEHPTGYCDFQHIAGRLRDRADQLTGRERCPGCLAADKGADRLEYRHARDCPAYDAFYDATDDELSSLVARDLPDTP